MTVKSILLMFFSGVLSFSSFAHDYRVKDPIFFRYDFSTRVPQTFLINKDGEVVYHQFSAKRNVLNALDNPQKLKNSEYHMSQFDNILGEPISYNNSGYTLVEIIWDKPSHPQNCDPCDRQVKINSAFLNAMKKKNIAIERSTIYVEFVETFIMDWDD